MEHTVKVWEKTYTVQVHQKSKAVWEAVGDYEGKDIQVKSRTSGAALRLWVDAARFPWKPPLH
ncbi:hypothetical protein GCM10007874_39850 [Labrys miyagiensis]|uniref:Uncharacterized protein n=1 Tax=Labrys miyagiensis TaxID=346912 RepID=A0ABQ6CL05_9HYPH|nr:hypothetical protein GCM10007874_39850 [Labrys miyagiensis]